MYNSNDIADRIRVVAKDNHIVIKDMLEEIGLGRNTMANLKTSIPKADNLGKIADYLDCSVDYLFGRTDIREINRSASGNIKYLSLAKSIICPMVGLAAAGKPLAMTVGSYDMINIDAVSDIHKKISHQDFVVEIHGDSMIEANIYNGDYAVIHPCPDAENGQIVLAAIDDDCTLKKFYRVPGGIELHPCNAAFPVQKYKLSDRIRILGKFVCTCKGNIIDL